jgi:hypothetical protein
MPWCATCCVWRFTPDSGDARDSAPDGDSTGLAPMPIAQPEVIKFKWRFATCRHSDLTTSFHAFELVVASAERLVTRDALKPVCGTRRAVTRIEYSNPSAASGRTRSFLWGSPSRGRVLGP